jgi:hypothetical protein
MMCSKIDHRCVTALVKATAATPVHDVLGSPVGQPSRDMWAGERERRDISRPYAVFCKVADVLRWKYTAWT